MSTTKETQQKFKWMKPWESVFKGTLAGVWANKRPEGLVLLHGITELEDNYQFDDYGLTGASCTQANPLMERRDWERCQLLWAQITGSYMPETLMSTLKCVAVQGL